MYKKVKINHVNDYFKPLSLRTQTGVYFYRINCYNKEIGKFLTDYFEKAAGCGTVIEQTLQNPQGNQLDYYNEIMGRDFRFDKLFMDTAVHKWLPRLNGSQRSSLVESMYSVLNDMKNQGKNENILKNAYVKFMCWLYYKFERVSKQAGQENIPKILYVGGISTYALKMLCILSQMGCDVVLLQIKDDGTYKVADPDSRESMVYSSSDTMVFPENFSIKFLKEQLAKGIMLRNFYKKDMLKTIATNTWISGNSFEDCLKPISSRGTDKNLVYNLFLRMTGVEDKTSYCRELYHFKLDIEKQGRNVWIIDRLFAPTTSEVQAINRKNYQNSGQLLMDLTGKIRCGTNRVFLNQCKKAFVEIIDQEAESDNINKLSSKAVSLLCFINRYANKISGNYKDDSINVCIYFGICRLGTESLFIRFLSKLPLDVLIFNPDCSQKCMLEDETLFDKTYDNTLKIDKFPMDINDVNYGTVAYHAEQDLNTILYQDSGVYRDRQYHKAKAVSLQTMYEEIYILWDQGVKYRPNFEIIEEQVILPVIISKVSGVKDGDMNKYWKDIKSLLVEDTIIWTQVPYIQPGSARAESTAGFIKNRKLKRQEIKNDKFYHYSVYREEVQDYLLDKLQELLDSGLINGTFSRGVEYTIIAVALNLDKEIARLIQKLDFTTKVPKIILVCTGETAFGLEDSILIALLHLLGFDIVMFVPTGYQLIEKYYTKPLFVEHQVGEYQYDLSVPNFSKLIKGTTKRDGIFNKFFKKGR